MSRARLLWPVFLWLIMLPGAAAATDASFLAERPCDLGGGYRLDLIFVDVAFGPFDAAAVVLVAHGVLVAWRPVGVGAFPLACETQSVFDQVNHIAWRPDPDQFASWKNVTDEPSEALWQFPVMMREPAPWGFVQGDVPPAPLLLLAEARFKMLWPAVTMTCLGLCGLIAAVWMTFGHGPRLWGALFIPFGVVWAAGWAGLALLFVILDAFSIALVAFAVVLSAVISVAVARIRFRPPRILRRK